ARALLEKARRAVIVEVGSAVRTYQGERAALGAAQRALRSARAEFTATRIGYANGASSSLDVEAARATYVQAMVGEISALYAQAQAQATLELLIGQPHA
ncbi:MAG TPA: TolC family protein, partial [Candidatus Lustribacter sp.]